MKYISLLLLAVGIASCDSDTVGTVTDTGVKDPFMPGNYWIYTHSNTPDQDSVIVGAHGNSLVYPDGNTYQVNKVGVWTDDFCEMLLCSFNPRVGDTLGISPRVSLKAGNKVMGAHIIASVGEVNIAVSVPAGLFIVSKFHWMGVADDGRVCFDLITYFSPTLGIIKQEVWDTDSDDVLRLQYTSELLRYKIR